ncbi:VOC family protein [Streptacidiphilus albus]|uniref:VOC family protein n=1 Tax=Streptacidiphilus albus TaxID=105425 RepID=UPI00054C5B27|nr:VOC family protein [Streptacidiphilus albus]
MSTRLSAVVVEALDPAAQAEFWAAALDWSLAEPGLPGGALAIGPGDPDGVRLLFVQTTVPKADKNRLHLDLASGPDQAAEVARLLALGAVRADIGQGAVPWEVLADPEGNELCVLPRPDAEEHLAAICQDAADVAVQGAFWQAATGWQVTDRGAWGIALRHPSGSGPQLVMGPPVASGPGRNRLRFAVSAAGAGDDPAIERARLLAAGATGPAHEPDGSQEQLLLTDPEGNAFQLART